MNAFIPEKPQVIILVNDDGDAVGVSNNISPDLEVTVCWTKAGFAEASQGLPFTVKD